MVRNCIIVHGCPDEEETLEKRTYDKHWIPWLKNQLEEKEIEVLVPSMPTPWKAIYEEWEEKFDRLDVNEDSVLVGHSCGAAFLVRWLGDAGKKIKKLILVAPWKIIYGDYLKREDKKAFYNYDINENVKNLVDEIMIFTSNDEENPGKETAKLFEKSLNGKIIELKNKGHYIFEDIDTEEFPELLEAILNNK